MSVYLASLDNKDTLKEDNFEINFSTVKDYIQKNKINNPEFFFNKLSFLLENKIQEQIQHIDIKMDEELPMYEIMCGIEAGFQIIKIIIDKIYEPESYFSKLVTKIIKGVAPIEQPAQQNLALILKNLLNSLNDQIALEFIEDDTCYALMREDPPKIQLSKSILHYPTHNDIFSILQVIHLVVHEYLHIETPGVKYNFMAELIPDLFPALVGIPNLPFNSSFVLYQDLPDGIIGMRLISGKRVARMKSLYKPNINERYSDSNILSGIIETKLFQLLFARTYKNPLEKFNKFIREVFNNPKQGPSLELVNTVLDGYNKGTFNFQKETKIFESIVRLNRAILQLSILEKLNKKL